MNNKHDFIARLFAGIICAALCVGMGLSAAAPIDKDSYTKLILGEMLQLSASSPEEASVLVDNSGMSGLESSIHITDTNTANMYVFDNNNTVVLSSTRVESLGQMFIWNYNEPGKLDCGVKELNVQYSVDGSTWMDAGNITLAQSSASENDIYGGCVAANLDEPFNFGGVAAKFIAITPISNHGGDKTGLTEIRIFRHKTRPSIDGIITGEVIVTTAGTTPEAAFTGMGMSDVFSATATASNNPSDMWLSTESADVSHFVMNLDGTYPLKSVTIWNYNNPDDLGSGIKEFKLYYTTQSPCSYKLEYDGSGKSTKQTFDFTRGDWKEVTIDNENVFILPQGTGKDGMAASLTLCFDEVIEAQHFKLVPVSNYGGSGYGLSEIRIFAGKGWGIEPSREWTGLLSSSGTFDYQGTAYNRQGGWVYADGVYSYHMNGAQSQGSLREDSVVFITFEDTAVGKLNGYKGFYPSRGYSNVTFSGWVNMSYLVLKGNKPDVRNAQFILQGKDSDIHPFNNIMAKHYWTGDFTLINGVLYVHAPDVAEDSTGVDMIAIYFNDDLTPNMDIVPEVVASRIPGYADGTVYENTAEAGAPNPDGYIYVYTKKSNGYYRAVRCLPEDFATNFDKYQFWGGKEKGWTNDLKDTTPLKANLSNYSSGAESAIAYMPTGYFAKKYINVYTEGSIGGQLRLGISDALTSMFAGEINKETGKAGNPMNIYWAQEKYKYVLYNGYNAFDLWAYNAKSHPALSEENELIISYHIGGQDNQSNTYGIEYTHPVFVNMFSIGYEGTQNYSGLPVYAYIGGSAVIAFAVVIIASVLAGGKKKKTVPAEAMAEINETTDDTTQTNVE